MKITVTLTKDGKDHALTYNDFNDHLSDDGVCEIASKTAREVLYAMNPNHIKPEIYVVDGTGKIVDTKNGTLKTPGEMTNKSKRYSVEVTADGKLYYVGRTFDTEHDANVYAKEMEKFNTKLDTREYRVIDNET